MTVLIPEAKTAIETLTRELAEARVGLANYGKTMTAISKAAHDEAVQLVTLRAELTATKVRLAEAELDLRAQECLQDSAYMAGAKAGWNYCMAGDEDGYRRMVDGTEHIAELRRIREERTFIAKHKGK